MSIKSILTVFSGYAQDVHALESALNLAHGLRATVRILHVAHPPMPDLAVSGIYGGIGYSDAGLLERLDRAEAELADAAESLAREACRRTGMNLLAKGDNGVMGQAQATFRTVTEDMRLALQREAATTDLIILRHDNRPVGDFEAVLAALLDAGRPVLLLPIHPGQPGFDHGFTGSAVVAWDGSPACGRALHEAVPLLLHAAGVSVLCVPEDGATEEQGDVMAYLRSHCIGADLIQVERGHRKTAEVLLTEAQRPGVNLLVMGAYGRGHVSEMLLGGTSDHILKHATIPLLLAH